MAFKGEVLIIAIPLCIGLIFFFLNKRSGEYNHIEKKDLKISRISFSGKIDTIAKDIGTVNYFIKVDNKQKKIYLPKGGEILEFVNNVSVGDYVIKRMFSSKIKVKTVNGDFAYDYPKDDVCFRKKKTYYYSD
jgi:hypothetical protein